MINSNNDEVAMIEWWFDCFDDDFLQFEFPHFPNSD
jgi:hypothetical protein